MKSYKIFILLFIFISYSNAFVFKIVPGSYTPPTGWRLMWKSECQANKSAVSATFGDWDIVYGDNFTINGYGYGN